MLMDKGLAARLVVDSAAFCQEYCLAMSASLWNGWGIVTRDWGSSWRGKYPPGISPRPDKGAGGSEASTPVTVSCLRNDGISMAIGLLLLLELPWGVSTEGPATSAEKRASELISAVWSREAVKLDVTLRVGGFSVAGEKAN